MFHAVDTDDSGDIDEQEFISVLIKLGMRPTPSTVAAMMAEANTSGSGTIDYAEFMKLMQKHVRARKRAHSFLFV